MLSPPPGIRDAEHVAKVGLSFISEDGDSFTRHRRHILRSGRCTHSTGVRRRGSNAQRYRQPSDARRMSDSSPVLGATGDYFVALGTSPVIGRFFGPADDEPPSGASVIVISYSYWQRTFAGDRTVLGRELIIDDQPFTIIGVAPRGFNGHGLGTIDAFMPLSATLRNSTNDWVSNRFLNVVSVVVRLRADVAPVAARQMASAALREEASGCRSIANSSR
jgi:hypothetical protein